MQGTNYIYCLFFNCVISLLFCKTGWHLADLPMKKPVPVVYHVYIFEYSVMLYNYVFVMLMSV